jgi:hypothetical protein
MGGMDLTWWSKIAKQVKLALKLCGVSCSRMMFLVWVKAVSGKQKSEL